MKKKQEIKKPRMSRIRTEVERDICTRNLYHIYKDKLEALAEKNGLKMAKSYKFYYYKPGPLTFLWKKHIMEFSISIFAFGIDLEDNSYLDLAEQVERLLGEYLEDYNKVYKKYPL